MGEHTARAASAGPGRPLKDLATLVGGEVVGDGSLSIRGVADLEAAGPSDIAFFANPRYRQALGATRAGAVIVDGSEDTSKNGRSYLRVANPYLAFARISQLFHPAAVVPAGVDARAFVAPGAKIDPSAAVMAFAFVSAGAEVGPRSVLHPGVYLGEQARVGTDCVLYPNVVVRERCLLGDRVIVQPGAVIGGDGFGFAFDPSGPAHRKVPQVGIARIEDDVEIGACSAVDRAALGETVVGRGTKIDNLVQVAHNVTIGPLSILCAQVGVSGSTQIGKGVVLAGQVGVVGHIRVGDGAIASAQAGVAQEVADGEKVGGTPAMPHAEWLRATVALRRLPEALKQLKQMQKRLDELEKRSR